MANPKKRLPNNVPGDFFVDSTCINCDTCRQLAPAIFGDDGEYSFVELQPQNPIQSREALRALLACPTQSIGTTGKVKAREVMADFPLLLEDQVYYCGFNSEDSFGGNSYFIQHPEGNWMIDSPRWTPFLVKQLERLGGVAKIFLTHRDDVADAAKYAKHFGAKRIIHEGDKSGMPDAEIFLEGMEPISMGRDFLIIPTPGHTRGHSVLLYKNKYLFSGDHLWWSRRTRHLGASRRHNWHSWKKQIDSIKRLQDYSFDWVLPGHGRRAHFPKEKMARELAELVEEMHA
jgi:glyoxylase-like metal-dependent hydrolase (beta-lactamase superfamily II)/ferredoxin